MRRAHLIAACIALLGTTVVVSSPTAVAADGGGRTLISNGSVVLSGLVGASGADGLSDPETAQSEEADAGNGGGNGGAKFVPRVNSSEIVHAGHEVGVTFEGLNHRDNRLANGGNQFSSEPPDQALCVGPEHVLESVNTVLRAYTKDGAPAGPVVSLNELFGYAPAIDRATGTFGAFITDPVCHFDAETGRYFLVVLTLDQDPVTGGFTGKDRLDIAVTATSDPTGTWFRYKLPVQNDGTEGTPNHHCDAGPGDPDQTSPSGCIGDYPHIGADANGFFITTNEYSFFGDGSNGGAAYTGSQIYVASKRALAAGGTTPQIVSFENPMLGRFRSFTVIPSIAAPGENLQANNGTELLMSSTLGDGSETGNTAPSENRIGVWAITNTASLDSGTPNLSLSNKLIVADRYSLPPKATQKDGPTPLRDCLNDRTDFFGPGLGCWALFLDAAPAALEPLNVLDSSDTRMGQVTYSHGQLWGALGTAVRVGDRGHRWGAATAVSIDSNDGKGNEGSVRAGVLWMNVDVRVTRGRLFAHTNDTGYLGNADNDLIYPAIGLTASGKTVLGMTVTGSDHFPSAGYAVLSDSGQESPTVKIISEGVGPHDGFTGYESLAGPAASARWGDYGATAVDGDTLWVANESIEQSCALDQYLTDPIGSCNATRTALANWSTRVSALHL